MKKALAMLFVCLVVFGTAGCGKEPPPVTEKPQKINLLGDAEFDNGFNLTGLDPEKDGNQIFAHFNYGGKAKGEPVWRVSQWKGKSDLRDAVEEENDNVYTYASGGKKFVVDKNKNSLLMEITGTQEYDAPRQSDEPWVHLLIEQSTPKIRYISELASVKAGLKIKLNKVDNLTGSEYNPNLHTAQFVWFIVIQNKPTGENKVIGKDPVTNKPIYEKGRDGDFIWFGVPIFDYGKIKSEKTVAIDVGTNQFMYGLANDEYLDTPFMVGEEQQFSVEILSYIKDALEKVQDAGGMKNVTFDNLAITGMNAGWEVPGIFNVSAQISDIHVTATLNN